MANDEPKECEAEMKDQDLDRTLSRMLAAVGADAEPALLTRARARIAARAARPALLRWAMRPAALGASMAIFVASAGLSFALVASAPEAPRLAEVGPATPDHTIYSKRLPWYVPLADPASPAAVVEATRAAVTRFVEAYTAYFEAHRHGELMKPGAGGEAAPVAPPTLTDPYPRVVLLPGLGMFTSGKHARTAGIVRTRSPSAESRTTHNWRKFVRLCRRPCRLITIAPLAPGR